MRYKLSYPNDLLKIGDSFDLTHFDLRLNAISGNIISDLVIHLQSFWNIYYSKKRQIALVLIVKQMLELKYIKWPYEWLK